MRISSSNIGMESSRNYYSLSSVKTSAFAATGKKGTLKENLNKTSSNSGIGRSSYLHSRDSLSTVRHKCMQYLMKILFGDNKRFDYRDLFTEVAESRNPSNQPVTDVLYYHKEIYLEESEDTSFSAAGTVKCEDGREININIDVKMSRRFSAYYETDYAVIRTRLCDPLVINFNGNTADLSDQTFYFDIDADGEKDEISMLKNGSGYLALDKNGDGIINDGNELFGAKSGNGFSDLAAYDSDSNGWIDENDEIWEKLLIWTKDDSGNDKCYRLSEKNVGAICLSSASTDFSLNSSDNRANGMVRKTGIFLYENGNAGTVQHVDVAKHQNLAERYEYTDPLLHIRQLEYVR